MTDQLARRLTIEEIVRVYEEETSAIRGSFARIAAAEKTLNEVFCPRGEWSSISVNHYRRTLDFASPEDTILHVRHAIWSAIVDRLEVRRMMSNARWVELQRQIERHELPEITHESVTQLASGFASNLNIMLKEAVEEVFSWLRPPHSDYKTNTELEVGRRVVLSHIVEKCGLLTSSWRVNYHRQQNLIALENVFNALDGRGQIAKSSYSAIENVIRAEGFDGVGETPLFKFKAFKNGNLHLEFRRLELLARFNQIAGGKRLRPTPEDSSTV